MAIEPQKSHTCQESLTLPPLIDGHALASQPAHRRTHYQVEEKTMKPETKAPMTDRVLAFIRVFYDEHKRPPMNTEVSKGLGLHPANVTMAVLKLAHRGLVKYEPRRPIQLIDAA